jgi:hypothetical protein
MNVGYPFTSESISLINRISSAYLGQFSDERLYGKLGEMPITHILWYHADQMTDYGGSLDAALDQYPILDKNWGNDIIKDEAEGMAVDFENKIYLACLVVNAHLALEGNTDNIWQEVILAKVFEEFKLDRANMEKKIKDMYQDAIGSAES